MASAIFEASAEEQALIIGPQGRNIIALAKQFNVRIQMPQPPSSTVKIDGEQTEAAITAIRQLLSRRNHLPSKTAKTKDNGLGTADSVPQLTDTLHTLRTSSHYYLKYQLRAKTEKFDEEAIKSWITENLESFFGVVGGGSVDVDVLVVNLSETSFIIRVPIDEVLGVQSCISLAQTYDDKPCAALLISSSPLLTALAAPQRSAGFSSFSVDNPEL